MVPRVPSPSSPALRALRRPRPSLGGPGAPPRSLISLATVIGRPITNPDGSELGRIVDAVARWQGDAYPPLTGLVADIARQRTFVAMANVATIDADGARLSSARLDLVAFLRRPGEVVLGGDVLDHQLVDVDGVQVIRASDLLIGRVGDTYRLVGVDVSLSSLLRRMGPRRFQQRPAPSKAIDWSLIQPLGAGGDVRITLPNRELHRLRPGEIADLLESLGRRERHELLGSLSGQAAADALEEMDAADVAALLREAPVDTAAELLAAMEPDEAVDALRDLEGDDRADLFAAMPPDTAAQLRSLLRFAPHTAGGVMTTVVVTAAGADTVAETRARLPALAEHRLDIDAVMVLDDQGRLLDDITLFELITAEPDQAMLELVGEPWPVTVLPDAPLPELVDALRENRRASTVVVDPEGRPIGRVLADDLLDALAPTSRPSRFSRMPS